MTSSIVTYPSLPENVRGVLPPLLPAWQKLSKWLHTRTGEEEDFAPQRSRFASILTQCVLCGSERCSINLGLRRQERWRHARGHEPEYRQGTEGGDRRVAAARGGELEAEWSAVRAGFVLEYFLKEIGPLLYNQGVEDAQKVLRGAVEDLPGTCFEEPMQYWERESGSRGAPAQAGEVATGLTTCLA